jgi:hypothetical protein
VLQKFKTLWFSGRFPLRGAPGLQGLEGNPAALDIQDLWLSKFASRRKWRKVIKIAVQIEGFKNWLDENLMARN